MNDKIGSAKKVLKSEIIKQITSHGSKNQAVEFALTLFQDFEIACNGVWILSMFLHVIADC